MRKNQANIKIGTSIVNYLFLLDFYYGRVKTLLCRKKTLYSVSVYGAWFINERH